MIWPGFEHYGILNPMPYKDPLKAAAAQKAWREKNIELTKKYSRDRRNKSRKFIYDYKIEHSVCVDCKISYPPHMLDFDHLKDKSFGIGKDSGQSVELIKKEIEKCEIVCANCHRHRTYMRSINKSKAGTKRIELSS